MGWSFDYFDVGRKAHIESLTGPSNFTPGYKPLEHRVVGNHVWQLVLIEATGRKLITLDLIAKERNGGWGNKGMSEDAGPNYYDCPLALLNKASPVTEGYAVQWRESVRQHHADKAARKSTVKPGAVVTYGGIEYTLIRPAGPRKGWVVQHPNGAQLRMNSRQLSKATP
jgi:hypothetical protein